MVARVFIQLKSGILDPQGVTIEKALSALDFTGINEVRVGKFIDINLESDDTSIVENMCKRLLVNSVIENYKIEVIS